MGREDLNELGIPGEPQETVLRLARLAHESRLDGVVCSAQEAELLRQELGTDFCLVTPGIRPANTSQDDQVRIVTPSEAIRLGSDYLVIGRPITKAADPLQVLQQINLELRGEKQ
jgi:orotidine-5'-phosphate decarboxylase